jgi:hypothetical protein
MNIYSQNLQEMVNVRGNPPPCLGRHGILTDSDGLSRSLDFYHYRCSMFRQPHTCYFCPSLGECLNPISHFRGPLNRFWGGSRKENKQCSSSRDTVKTWRGCPHPSISLIPSGSKWMWSLTLVSRSRPRRAFRNDQKGMGHLMPAQIHLTLASPLICLGFSGSLHETNFLRQWPSRFI